MIYDSENVVQRTRVFDVDTKEEIKQVKSIHTRAGVVECFETPLRIDGKKLVTFTLRYRSIYPIYGESPLPCLFHCYGRIE